MKDLKLTQIIAGVRSGLSLSAAARLAGVSTCEVHEWSAAGEQPGSPYQPFREGLRQARLEHARRHAERVALLVSND